MGTTDCGRSSDAPVFALPPLVRVFNLNDSAILFRRLVLQSDVEHKATLSAKVFTSGGEGTPSKYLYKKLEWVELLDHYRNPSLAGRDTLLG
jgi:hypothetical protein